MPSKADELQKMLAGSSSLSEREKTVLTGLAPVMREADVDRFLGILKFEMQMRPDITEIGRNLEKGLGEIFDAVERGFELYRRKIIKKAESSSREGDVAQAENKIKNL
jgi:hypothetical protein